MQILKRVALCERPSTPLNQWMLWKHQVLRVIWVPPGEDRGYLGGLLGISVLISMMVMFMFWHTNAICKQQDACNELCTDSGAGGNKCATGLSVYNNMSINLLNKNTSSSFDAWPNCLKTANDWLSKPGNPLTELVCYFPNAQDQNTIACLIPLQGDACEQEKKYQKMLTGASSVLVIITFLLVPRMVEFIFSLIFGLCCEQVYVRARGKTVRGLSLGVGILVVIGILVALLVLNGGTGFIGLRIMVWFVTWLGSMVIVEPLACLLSYYVIRCRKPEEMPDYQNDEDPREDKPLLQEPTRLSGHTGMAAAPNTIDHNATLSDLDSLPVDAPQNP